MEHVMNEQPDVTVVTRPLQRTDYDQVRQLLLDTLAITPVGFNWDIRRWEGKGWDTKRKQGILMGTTTVSF